MTYCKEIDEIFNQLKREELAADLRREIAGWMSACQRFINVHKWLTHHLEEDISYLIMSRKCLQRARTRYAELQELEAAQ